MNERLTGRVQLLKLMGCNQDVSLELQKHSYCNKTLTLTFSCYRECLKQTDKN